MPLSIRIAGANIKKEFEIEKISPIFLSKTCKMACFLSLGYSNAAN
jgi:hypothetical protein